MTALLRVRLAGAVSVSLWLLSVPAEAADAGKQPPVPPVHTALSIPLPTNSPVALFRELLAMDTAQRKQWLTNRPPEVQRQILAKLREYESLSPSERKLRLDVTELGWYMRWLLAGPVAQRATLLSMVPADNRKLVIDRLRQWDRLPPETQQQLLENEATLRYMADVAGASEEQQRIALNNISPERRKKLEAGLARWRELSEPEQKKIASRFNQFFQLTDEEQSKALATLSEEERRQMERTMQTFDRLPSAQRIQCIRSFTKYASMSLSERQQFLKNAERWKLMTPEERNSWRQVVNKLASQPPLPPSGSPPLPRLFPPSTRRVATNGTF